MKWSDATDQIVGALVKAQSEITPPIKNREGQARGGRYHYADLASVIDAIRAPLAANGLAITSGTGIEGDRHILTTRLAHISGQWVEAVYPLPGGGSSQEMGSAITYGRRYTISALLGIASEDDDDGAAAATKPLSAKTPPPKPRLAPVEPPPPAEADRVTEIKEKFSSPAPAASEPLTLAGQILAVDEPKKGIWRVTMLDKTEIATLSHELKTVAENMMMSEDQVVITYKLNPKGTKVAVNIEVKT